MSTENQSQNGGRDAQSDPVFDLPDILVGVDLAVPERYATHPLIQGKTFYTLSVTLLDELQQTLGCAAFDQELFDMERALAEQLKPIPAFVGFRDGQAIRYELLAPEPAALPPADQATLDRLKWNLTVGEYAAICETAQKRIKPYRVAMRGYVGWLLTNRQFLDDRDQLFQKWPDHLAKHGIPQSGPTTFGGVPHRDMFRPVRDKTMLDFLNDFAAFYARWRLQHLNTRELPEPLALQIPLVTPLALLTHMEAGSVSLYQPDTMPVPPRDQLRHALDDVRVARENDHLREWIKIVRHERHSNWALDAYGDIFALHHYRTVLLQRHAEVFSRRLGKLDEAFAGFLGRGIRTVENHRARIRTRLG